MGTNTGRKFSPGFKANVVLEALSKRWTLEEIAHWYALHPNQITHRKQLTTDQFS